MAYIYSDLNTFSAGVRAGTKCNLNTFSAGVRAGTKCIFCRCPRVDCNVFCIRGERELKEGTY